MSERAPAADDSWRLFRLVLVAALIANGIMLLFDRQPQFFDGDSMVYLGSAFGGGGPGDRSFAYGRYIIRPLLWIFGSLNAVVVFQAVLASFCAAMLAAILRIGLGAERWVSAAVGLAYVAEPLSLLYQRMMMTEAAALFFYAVFLLLSVVYLRLPSLRLLAGTVLASVACLALRVSFMPVLVITILLLPPLAIIRQWQPSRVVLTRCATHLAVAVGLTLATHALYRQLFHSVTGNPPGYNSADGFFLLAAWAPLVAPADFPDPALFDRIRPTLGELPNRFTRPGQRYSPGGLINRLIESEHNNERAANALAKQIALNIVQRDPLGVLALGWQTYMDFWNPQVMAGVLQIDEGPQEADPPIIDRFRTRYHEDIAANHLTPTITKSWHRQATGWYRVLLLTPAIWIAALVLRPRWWRPMLLIGISVIGLFLVDTLLVIEPVVRYLHSIAWLALLLVGVVVQGIWELARPRSASPSLA